MLSGRSELWPLGLKLFQESPLIGHGIGSSETLTSEYSWIFIESQGAHFHNSYITIAVETGAVCFAIFALIMVAALQKGLASLGRPTRLQANNRSAAALPFILVVGALGHAFFETWLLSAGNTNMVLFWTCVWLVLGQRRQFAPTRQKVTTWRTATV
jgi:O-antigen ligase